MRNWLQNKYVILTGASGGIGRELCKLLVIKYNAKVIGVGRSEEKMRTLKTELGEQADNFSYRLFDVGDKAAWTAFCDELAANAISPSLLINNAGVFPPFGRVLDGSIEEVERVTRINYLSIVYATKALSPILCGDEKNKPAIVNVSSSSALCTVVGAAAYSASKAAIKGYTEALQLEETGKKYVGVVYPGTTATDLFRDDKNTKNSALDYIAMPAEKMAKKIVRKILKKKKRAVLGWDAKLMALTAKLAPVTGLALIRGVMKLSRSKVFSKVFDQGKKEK